MHRPNRLTAAGDASEEAQDAAEAPAAEPVDLIVFAAASMTGDSWSEIAELYKGAAPEVTVTCNFDSSGKPLKTQIQEGADCDLFISAAPTQMNAARRQPHRRRGRQARRAWTSCVIRQPC